MDIERVSITCERLIGGTECRHRLEGTRLFAPFEEIAGADTVRERARRWTDDPIPVRQWLDQDSKIAEAPLTPIPSISVSAITDVSPGLRRGERARIGRPARVSSAANRRMSWRASFLVLPNWRWAARRASSGVMPRRQALFQHVQVGAELFVESDRDEPWIHLGAASRRTRPMRPATRSQFSVPRASCFRPLR